jgi:putative ABC transport system ATP-binding protein
MGALAEVGLDGYAKRFPSQLSGGQQQRVAIARAMVTDPQIVFADEPTANLDSKSAEKLLHLFSRLNESRETTFLFSSHDPRVLAIARRIITLHDGRISYDSLHKGAPAQSDHSAPRLGVGESRDFNFQSPWRGEA